LRKKRKVSLNNLLKKKKSLATTEENEEGELEYRKGSAHRTLLKGHYQAKSVGEESVAKRSLNKTSKSLAHRGVKKTFGPEGEEREGKTLRDAAT